MISPEILNKALTLLQKGTANYEYFFSKLSSPDWIEPLQERKFFRVPPPVVQNDGRITFARWPETEYLARMATKVPELVVKILKAVDATDNPRVHEDIADAALAMPGSEAAKLVPLLKKCVQHPYQILLPHKLSALVSRLLDAKEAKSALQLFEALLRFRPNTDEDTQFRPHPRAAFDDHQYQDIVEKHSLPLSAQEGAGTLRILICALNDYTKLSRKSEEDPGPEDLSCIPRPAVEDHEQNRSGGVFNSLTLAVRDVSQLVSTQGLAQRIQVIDLLDKQPWLIFIRIILYVLANTPDATVNEVTRFLLRRDIFDGFSTRHEYGLLLKRFFSHLNVEQKQLILNWIDEQDLEDIAKQYGNGGQSLTLEQSERIANRRRLQHLVTISDDLSVEWRARYDAMTESLGVPEHPEFPVYSYGILCGPVSPKTPDELRAMPVAEIAAYVKSWQAPLDTGFGMPPSPEGLGRDIRSVVRERYADFATRAMLFADADATYVRAALAGLRQALSDGLTFDFSAVFELCDWVISQPYTGRTDPTTLGNRDPDWSWTRQEAAELLSAGAQYNTFPIDCRDTVWNLLTRLTDDPDPSPEYELRHSYEPELLSYNTVRGVAMHAVPEYALWVRRQLGTDTSNAPEANVTPEIIPTLETHLNTAIDSSLAVRAVYGRWFPWLNLIDPVWSKGWIGAIFPDEPEQAAYWKAAWGAYLAFCQPYDNVLSVLKPQYQRAVDALSVQLEPNSPSTEHERLAEHLMVYMMGGILPPDDPLLIGFFDSAPSKIREHAISFVGMSLKQAPAMGHAVADRVVALWELLSLGSGALKDDRSSFGWLFATGRFEAEWAIQHLKLSIQQKYVVSNGDGVMEELARLAPAYPSVVLECIRLMIESKKEDWSIPFWRDEIVVALSVILGASDPAVVAKAVELVHRLGAMGHHHFRSLIDAKGRGD